MGGFRKPLAKALKRCDDAKGGRPPFDAVMMFKIMVLQALCSHSDDQAEFQIQDRLSFAACFHGHNASGQLADEIRNAVTTKTPAQNHSTSFIQPDEAAHVLAKIKFQARRSTSVRSSLVTKKSNSNGYLGEGRAIPQSQIAAPQNPFLDFPNVLSAIHLSTQGHLPSLDGSRNSSLGQGLCKRGRLPVNQCVMMSCRWSSSCP